MRKARLWSARQLARVINFLNLGVAEGRVWMKDDFLS